MNQQPVKPEKKVVSSVVREIINVSVNDLTKQIHIRADTKDMSFFLRCLAELVGMCSNIEYQKKMKDKGNIIVPQTIVKGGVN